VQAQNGGENVELMLKIEVIDAHDRADAVAQPSFSFRLTKSKARPIMRT
jgi:hypothetical protein